MNSPGSAAGRGRYRQIVDDFRSRITAGELPNGARLPSIRQVAQDWRVALATATKAMAALRDEGLIEPRVGAGTVVRAAGSAGPSEPDDDKHAGLPVRVKAPIDRELVLRTAIGIADVEGLEAVTMRRLAAELGIAVMSLYRYVANKEDLVEQMADMAFGAHQLPELGLVGWRAKLEFGARQQWAMCGQHPWLPRVVSFTRPLLMPQAMSHTEWFLAALEDVDLPLEMKLREVICLVSIVVTYGTSAAAEFEARQERGETMAHWWRDREGRADELLASGRFPYLAATSGDWIGDLDGLFEYALARHLDGFALLLET
ncbi:TetR family transcriptional regulator [Tamaricihabitans halophyticus]|uniref:TetR family transcriptional regulator n=1 Tax=Tamaricihabitans halophyticus TaxID=1262583 RepID=A0A4R2QU64_9PSEU|nr:TetR/AcrR family transcriptional regulator C-terminal domain-containing protein [Tamaricihabitans halophyticus]TCP53512.1 TetR family transcriptional regulator [Tamaricihabitans halophyticus]